MKVVEKICSHRINKQYFLDGLADKEAELLVAKRL